MSQQFECRYCGSTHESQEQLTKHLAEQHDSDGLSRIDRRRVEQYEQNRPSAISKLSNNYLSRRTILASVGVSLTGLVGTTDAHSHIGNPLPTGTQTSGEKEPPDEQSIDLSNDVHDITFGELSSGNWEYESTDQLFDEFYALRSDGTTSRSGRVIGTILESYPDDGDTGTVYSALVELGGLDSLVEITRLVKLDPEDALITVTYEIDNVGDSDLTDLKFYQYIDYDVDGFSRRDEGEYVAPDEPDRTFEYLLQDDGGTFTGYRATVLSDQHDIDNIGNVSDRITGDGELRNDVTSGPADLESAIRLDLGTLAPGEETARTLGFAVGDDQSEVETLLADIEPLDDTSPAAIRVEGDNVTISNSTIRVGDDED